MYIYNKKQWVTFRKVMDISKRRIRVPVDGINAALDSAERSVSLHLP